MKYNFLAIGILLFVFGSCNKRQTSLDRESAEVDSLLAVYEGSIQTDPVSVIAQIKEKQRAMEDSVNYYRLHALLGVGYYEAGYADSAITTDKSVIRFCRSVRQADSDIANISTMEAVAYNNIGLLFQVAGQNDSAIAYQHKVIENIVRSGDARKLPDRYINIADCYSHKGDFPMAADRYRRALFIADSLHLNDQLIVIYSGLALTYTHLKNYKEADSFFNRVEAVYDTIPPFEQYFFANCRCNYYHSTKEYEQSLFWIKRANKVAMSLAHPSFRATTEINLGEVYLLLNRPDSAKHYLDRAAGFFMGEDSYEAAKYYLNGLYAAYCLQKNDLRKAEEYLSVSYDMTQVNPYYIYFNDLRQEELYRKRGDYRRAYEMTKKAQLYDDSARNATRQNQIAEIDFRYRQDTILLKRNFELVNKEHQIVQLKQTNILTFSMLGVFVLLVVTVTVYKRKKRELQRARQVVTITKLRMESIRNRISPHFMFNVLNSVVPNLREYPDLTQPMQLLVESIRGNLLISEKIALTLEEEIGIVKNYLALLESINDSNPQVVWDIEPDVDLLILVPSMIIQIPVENAIKYAFEGYDCDKLLKIHISIRQRSVFIEVCDNGIGFDPGRIARTGKGTGTGLRILYKTIEMFNMMNQEKIEFEIKNEMNTSSDVHGTKVHIKIPLEYIYEV